jgi:uncharacterized protein YkwD
MVLLLAFLAPGCHEPVEPVLETQQSSLLDVLNAHRQALGLPTLARTAALDEVAEAHLYDLQGMRPEEPCSLHSWSAAGPWSPCCYLRNQSDTSCMLEKPKEISGYSGVGYEIAVEYFGTEPLSAEKALQLWLDSPAHRSVIENTDMWEGKQWQGVGTALSENYAVIWFGADRD